MIIMDTMVKGTTQWRMNPIKDSNSWQASRARLRGIVPSTEYMTGNGKKATSCDISKTDSTGLS